MRNYLLKNSSGAGQKNNRNYALKHAARDINNIKNRDYNNTRYSKRLSFSDAGYNIKVENRSVKSYDAISNPIARLGAGTENIINAHEYINERITLNYQLLNTLYRDNWIVQNIVQSVPSDIVKKWFTISADVSPEELDKVNTYIRNISLQQKISEGMRWGRLYGGAIGLLLIKGQTENLDEPLNLDTVLPGTFFGIFILERWQSVMPDTEIVLNPADPDFGLPEYYLITDSVTNITARVHHTKVIRFEGRQLPMYERLNEQFWGVSEIESAYREIVRRDTTAENIASLVFKANLSVMHIKDLDQIFAINSVQAQERFWNTLQSIATVESSMGIKLVGAEDRAEYLNYGFNGIKDIYEGIMMDLSGATHIPVTKLFGRSPAGMNSTGESDLQNYYDYIDEVRDTQFRPIIKKLLPILALSVWGEIPKNLDFEFPEMKTLTDAEKAQLAQQLSGTIIEAFNSNLITQDIAQKELKNLSEKYDIFTNITDELIKQCEGKFINDLQQMQDPMAGMGGGGNEQDLMAMLGGGQNEPSGAGQNMQPNANEQQDAINDNTTKPTEQDELEKRLLSLKEAIINNKPDVSNYKLDLNIDTNANVDNKENMLLEYERLDKINKGLQKDYDKATTIIYGYSNENQIPLNVINAFNNIKNKYMNSINNLNALKQKIQQAGYNIDLMKQTGDFDKEMKDIEVELNDIKQKANLLSQQSFTTDAAPDDKRLKLIEIIDFLISLNKKINEMSNTIQVRSRDLELNNINDKINKLFEVM